MSYDRSAYFVHSKVFVRTFMAFPVTKAIFNVRSCHGNDVGGLEDEEEEDDDKAWQ
jgi:hypothetical protein